MKLALVAEESRHASTPGTTGSVTGADTHDAKMDPAIIDRQLVLEQLLRSRERVLLNEVRALRTRPFEPVIETVPPGAMDDETIASAIDLRVLEAYRDLLELRAIDAALRRLANGTYWSCADCGGEIDYLSLHAQPVSQRCGKCQDDHQHF